MPGSSLFLWCLPSPLLRLLRSLAHPSPLPALLPQAYLLRESTMPSRSTAIYLTALDFYPHWPFSHSFDLIQFPGVLLVMDSLGPCADGCCCVLHAPSGLPGMQQACLLAIQATWLCARAVMRREALNALAPLPGMKHVLFMYVGVLTRSF